MASPTRLSCIPAVPPASVLASPDALVVDLRSPSEFALDHLPGAHNVPLFDDAGRALVGALYRQRSPDAAFDEGRRQAAEGVDGLVRRVATLAGWRPPAVDFASEVRRRTAPGLRALEGELAVEAQDSLEPGSVVLHCWRGGLRSRSVVALLRDLGLRRAVAMEGGYRAYRALVRDELAGWKAPPTFVLRGWTGVGKTLVLRALEELLPGSSVDLEGLADHRGSVLGMVGLRPCSQKTFDSRLFARLRRGFPGGFCVLEGESRKVGDVVLPESVWRALEVGESLELRAPLGRRVQVLVDEYLSDPANREELRARLPFLEGRLGRKRWKGALVRLLDQGREHELVEVLLKRYYDPLYRRSERGRRCPAAVDASDPTRAARDVADWIARRLAGATGKP